MKILFAHQHLGAMGGAETNILLTAAELKSRGHAVGLLFGKLTGRCEAGWRAVFDYYTPIPRAGNSEHLEAALEQFDPDLVFVHNLPNLWVLRSLLDTGIPMVRMVHDHSLYCLRTYKYNYFTRAICRRPASATCVFPCLAVIARNRNGTLPVKWASLKAKHYELALNRRCDHFVVYSHYCRGELVRNGFPPEKITLYSPVQSPAGGVETLSSFSARNLVLFAGQIIRGKGVDVLLRALAQVRVPFECVILGDGGHRRHCERLAGRLGLNGRVRFMGYLPRQEMTPYFLEASLLAVSSVWPEPFGMVGPEAMHFGLPVVAFEAGGIPEWLTDGQNGILVPWMDIRGFAAGIEKLLRDKALGRQMGCAGRLRVMRDFNVRLQVENLSHLFQDVVATKSLIETNETAGLNVVHGNRRK